MTEFHLSFSSFSFHWFHFISFHFIRYFWDAIFIFIIFLLLIFLPFVFHTLIDRLYYFLHFILRIFSSTPDIFPDEYRYFTFIFMISFSFIIFSWAFIFSFSQIFRFHIFFHFTFSHHDTNSHHWFSFFISCTPLISLHTYISLFSLTGFLENETFRGFSFHIATLLFFSLFRLVAWL